MKIKKFQLFIPIVLFIFIYMAITWFTMENPIGLFNFGYVIHNTYTSFISMFVYIISIFGFYSVIKQTGAYYKVVNYIANFVNHKIFLALVIFGISLISAVTGATIELIFILPFIISIIKTMGFNKNTSMLAVIVPTLTGVIGSFSGYFINMQLYNTFEDGLIYTTSTYDNIFVFKLIFFIVTTAILIGYTLFINKNHKEKVLLVHEKGVDVNDKPVLPFVIMFSLLITVMFIFIIPWYSHETSAIMDGYAEYQPTIINKVIGDVYLFDSNFTEYNDVVKRQIEYGYLSVLILIFTIIIGFIYRLKIDKTLDLFIDGAKKYTSIIFIAILACSITVMTLQYPIYTQLLEFISTTFKNIPIFSSLINTIITVVCNPNLDYLIYSDSISIISSNAKTIGEILPVLMQVIYGYLMILLPTSIILIIGLKYINMSYFTYLKENKFLFLILLLVILLITALMLVFI